MSVAYRSRIITYENGSIRDYPNAYLMVHEGKIVGIREEKPETRVVDYSDYVILPGLVDAHTHLAQIDARAKWSPNLLDWLERYIFPTEANFRDEDYAREKAEEFFFRLARNGTTTAAVFSSPYREATDIAFQEARKAGLRVVMGQVLMDMNAPDELLTTPEDAAKDTMTLAEKWHGKDNLYYAVTPRFAVTCSQKLMRKVSSIARDMGLYIQSHLSEQEEEIEEALRIHPEHGSYADIYYRAGLLGPRSIMAHAVHPSDKDLEILKLTDTRIAHCPSSNFFLHSGIMPLRRIKGYGLSIALGSDIAAGPYFSMFQVARDASYANRITPEENFYLLTLGGARALGFEHTGSLEPGKSADFIVVSAKGGDTWDLLSHLIYLGDERNILATYVRGKEIYSDF